MTWASSLSGRSSRQPAVVLAATAAALMLAACQEGGVKISTSGGDAKSQGVLKVIDALHCPQTAGVLTRRGSAQAGGDTCVYAGPRGSEVVLSLVRLDGRSAEAVLSGLERQMAADLPQALARMDAAEAGRAARAGQIPSEDAPSATQMGEQPGQDAASASPTPNDHTLIEAPGVRIEARGEDASVRLPGLRIESRGDQATVRIGGLRIGSDKTGEGPIAEPGGEAVRIRAGAGSAEVRTQAPGGAVRSTYVLTDDTPSPDGWRLVGFEARGPTGGPIVVAAIRSKEKSEGELFDAARSLVSLNVGR